MKPVSVKFLIATLKVYVLSRKISVNVSIADCEPHFQARFQVGNIYVEVIIVSPSFVSRINLNVANLWFVTCSADAP